ncbi:hypothetical protein FGK63_20405 [Ruegeria sediminis]|uniref:Uncharacterized protein n=1 Tax=Ruegeria sediminis TaxID=2583820 RepID=A0ABY2WSZ3_9RHOB|nr:hypothetical protein [Ruegeria sediminis]TMV02592.1 hypothetical protein FGK63_20405 [Ruegeria sediminis]
MESFGQFLFGLGKYLWSLAAIFAALVVGNQVYVFLADGVWPERDLFWLIAPEGCEKAAEGFGAKDICRENYIEISSWVGLNKILNLLLDMYLPVLILVLAAVIFWFLWKLADLVGSEFSS